MNDQTPLIGNSRDDRLPSEAEIEQRIAEIESRQQKRQQVREQLEFGSVAEAWKMAVAASIPLADVPGLMEKYADNLYHQENKIQEQAESIKEALNQIHQSINEVDRAFQLEKWLTAFSQADTALENLDIEMLKISVNTLRQHESFSESQLGTSQTESIQEAPEWLHERLEELENDLRWLELRKSDQDFRNAQTDLRNWLNFVSNCDAGKSRLSLLHRQKMASLFLNYEGAEYPHEQRFSKIEEAIREGQSEQARVLIDRVEQELKDSKTRLTPIEMLGIKNQLWILKHHLSLYIEARHSLSQARDVIRGAQKHKTSASSDKLQGIYAVALSATLQRLKRDREAMPSFVMSCNLSGKELSHYLEQAIKALEMLAGGVQNG